MTNIKRLRKKMKITQAELAEKIGVSQSAVCQWEIGFTKPTRQNMIEIAAALHCKVDDLIKEE